MSAAVFFDRDGTLVRDVGYIKSAADLELVPQAIDAVRRLNCALRPVVVVTNQSGIARGLLSEEDYARVRERLDAMLAEHGAHINAQYHCPHHPDFTGPCECRKPGVALFEQAIHEHSINPRLSVFVGDRWRDIEPALHYGARGILVPTEATPAEEVDQAKRVLELADTLTAAVQRILDV